MNEKEFLVRILEICDHQPDVHNPSNGNYCLYKANPDIEKYPEAAAKHCLIGQFLVEEGYEVPDIVAGADKVFENFEKLYHLAVLAADIQRIADGYPALKAGPPQLWGKVAQQIRARYAPELAEE